MDRPVRVDRLRTKSDLRLRQRHLLQLLPAMSEALVLEEENMMVWIVLWAIHIIHGLTIILDLTRVTLGHNRLMAICNEITIGRLDHDRWISKSEPAALVVPSSSRLIEDFHMHSQKAEPLVPI